MFVCICLLPSFLHRLQFPFDLVFKILHLILLLYSWRIPLHVLNWSSERFGLYANFFVNVWCWPAHLGASFWAALSGPILFSPVYCLTQLGPCPACLPGLCRVDPPLSNLIPMATEGSHALNMPESLLLVQPLPVFILLFNSNLSFKDQLQW